MIMFVHLKIIIKIKEAVIKVPREGVEQESNITLNRLEPINEFRVV